MKLCLECNLSFESSRSYSNHIRWVHKKIEYKRVCCLNCRKEIRCENIQKHLHKCPTKKFCKHCNTHLNDFKLKFCNLKCAAHFNNANRISPDRSYITTEWKEKMRMLAKRQWEDGTHNTNKRQIFSSKTEREIVNHFKTKFPQDEWKSGGRLKISETETLSRDLWSNKLKICFEYDGIWHFKDIHGQLSKKQYKDILLEQWCIKNNYRLIRIDEESYKSFSQLEELIYNKQDRVIKIGNRY